MSDDPVPTTRPDVTGGAPAPGGGTSDTVQDGGRPAPYLADVASGIGLEQEHGAFRWDVSADPVAMMGGGVCWLDFDGDGWLDLFLVNSHALTEAARWRDEDGELPRTALFRNVEGELVDLSAESGADLPLRGNGCVAADFDLDGHMDLYVTAAGVDALLWNDGDGSFTEGAVEAGVAASGWQAGAAVADVTGNGWPDLFVAGYADVNTRVPEATQGFPHTFRALPDRLYVNEGPGDDGRVTFREVGVEAGVAGDGVGDAHALGALFSDLTGDGALELYVANDASPNRLYRNVPWPGGADADPHGLGFRFEEVAASFGVDDDHAGMGVAVGHHGDGVLDLVATNAHGQPHAAFRSGDADPGPSRGAGAVSRRPDVDHGAFANVSSALGVDRGEHTGWGVSWADLTLDGRLDLLVANGHVPMTDLAADAEPLQLFAAADPFSGPGHPRESDGAGGHDEARRAEPGGPASGSGLRSDVLAGPVGFDEIGAALGLGEVGPLNARGVAVADFDNDGRLDVAVSSIGGPLTLLRNEGTTGHWLTVVLDRFDPGAVVTVTLPDGRELVREARAGGSYLSSEDPRLHFGLADAAKVDRIEVRWTDGTETVHGDVAADQFVVLTPP